MIAYLRLLAVRWLRRTGGRGALLSAVVGPAAPALATWYMFEQGLMSVPAKVADGTFQPAFVGVSVGLVAAAAMLGTVNLIVTTVHEEQLYGRGRMLRVSGIDGWRPAAAYLSLATLLALLQATFGYLVPALVGTRLGITLSGWTLLVPWTALGAVAVGALAVLLRLLLPQGAALVASNLAAIVGSALIVLNIQRLDEQPMALAWLAVSAVAVVGMVAALPLIWPRLAERHLA